MGCVQELLKDFVAKGGFPIGYHGVNRVRTHTPAGEEAGRTRGRQPRRATLVAPAVPRRPAAHASLPKAPAPWPQTEFSGKLHAALTALFVLGGWAFMHLAITSYIFRACAGPKHPSRGPSRCSGCVSSARAPLLWRRRPPPVPAHLRLRCRLLAPAAAAGTSCGPPLSLRRFPSLTRRPRRSRAAVALYRQRQLSSLAFGP